MTRVVIVGAGIVGAACAYYAARAGLDVTVLERAVGRRRHHRRRRGQPAALGQGARPRTRPGAALAAAVGRAGRRVRRRRLRVRAQGRPGRRQDRRRRSTALAALAAEQRAAGVERRSSSTAAGCASSSRTWPGGLPAACSTPPTPRSSRCSPPPGCCRPRVGAGASCGSATRSPASTLADGRVGAVARPEGRSRPTTSSTPPAPGPGELSALLRRARPGPAAARIHPGHRAAAADDPAQGLLGRLRGQRRLERGRPRDVVGDRGNPLGHRADRRQPRAGRLRAHDLAPDRAPAGGARPSSCSRCCATVNLMRVYLGFRPVLPRPPADHRRRTSACPVCCTRAATRAPGSGWPRPPVS